MIELTQEELKQHFSEPIFGQIAETADALGLECYVVGGYVRDIFLQRPSKDIDVVVVGSGIAMAEALGKRLGRGRARRRLRRPDHRSVQHRNEDFRLHRGAERTKIREYFRSAPEVSFL